MKRFRFLFVSALLLSVASSELAGQVAYAPEKVFVHLDRTYFAVGETIWMKGYVESIAPVPDTSRFLYVELIDGEGGETVLRNKIRLGDDGFAGYLDLPENMAGGRYMLRAYTRWQMNWPEEWMFHTLVDIYDGTEDESPEPETGQVDISFYPEGGRYFSERHATVGFKAMAADGKYVEWSGALYDDQGVKICDCRTEHAGMGLIGFTPKEGRRYRLVGGSGGHSWDLPGASKEGATM